MILIVGGLGAGKRDYVLQTLGYEEGQLSRRMEDDAPVLLDLQDCIREESGFCEESFAALCAKEVVVCDEVGCGVVPMDASERRWRDEVGRACARLAGEADRVVRLVCGVAQVIKGEKQ